MNYKMSARELLSVLNVPVNDDANCEILGLCLDSRQVKAGELFVAYPGEHSDGLDFLASAQAVGAAAIVYESNDFEPTEELSIPSFAVSQLQLKLGTLADHFYHQPSSELQVFGVTGTNGKTTCCYLLAQALQKLGLRVGFMGTLGVGEIDQLESSGFTTPDAISIQKKLALWRDQGVTQVCMEVSSHALHQGRVNGIKFFCSLFTNLSHDHLDYHSSMQDYAAAKRRLFTDFPAELVISNLDDSLGLEISQSANAEFVVSYAEQSTAADVHLEEVTLNATGMELLIEANSIDLQVQTPLVGKVNIPNVLLLVATLLALSTPLDTIAEILAELKAAPGRMEIYHAPSRPTVIIDYAHTPDALQKALDSIQQHCQGELWCVFGCGGDRDKEKRPVMGAAAESLANHLIVTNDNPRSEEPAKIAAQIMAGIKGQADVVLDRAAAIKTAIERASEHDWVLVAGKGHETTQDIAGQLLPFSDREQVLKALAVAA